MYLAWGGLALHEDWATAVVSLKGHALQGSHSRGCVGLTFRASSSRELSNH